MVHLPRPIPSTSHIPQTDPPRSPRETLPTMYDLPSENPEEPGLPDVFHDLQPELLSQTCQSPHYPGDRMFTGTDMNLYYDSKHPLWYKRPDWFLAAGVPHLYDDTDMRLSYVVWQEGVDPLVVVELLSPGTEEDDLGHNVRPVDKIQATDTDDLAAEKGEEGVEEARLSPIKTNNDIHNDLVQPDDPTTLRPPAKWTVYESILRVPYYLVFSRYTNRLRAFHLVGDHYEELDLDAQKPQVWIPKLGLGIGVWHGSYNRITRPWLRWYNDREEWIPTFAEQAEAEKERAEAEKERAEAEKERAEAEKERAETEQQRAEAEKERANAAESQLRQEQQEKEQLLERLRQLESQLANQPDPPSD